MRLNSEIINKVTSLENELFKICLYLSIDSYVSVKRTRAVTYREDHIKELMRQKGVTFKDISKHLYITMPRAWQILNGYAVSTEIKRKYIPKIMDYLIK